MFKRRSTLRSPEFARKKRKQFLLRLFVWIFVLAIILVVPPYLSHLSSVNINAIDIGGNEVVTYGELDKYVRDEISGKYLWVFSKSNILIYPQEKIERDILRDFPRIESVSVSFKSLKSIRVIVQERKPDALWCKSNDDCYFINQDGLIFTKAPKFSASVYVRYYGHVATSTDPIFAQYVDEKKFRDISTFVSAIGALGFSVSDALLFDDESMELHLNTGGKILIDTREDFSVTLENFRSLLSDKTSVPKLADFIAKLNYVDLRFGKKLFFKLR